MTADHLKHICNLTLGLTKLRQNEAKNLIVENFAPELFYELLAAAVMIESNTPGGVAAQPAGAEAESIGEELAGSTGNPTDPSP